MKSNEIRERFLAFFEKHGHRRVASSSLIPANDPTLLFANAGMNQFKETFLGQEKRDYATAASSQKCVRAGGKHNDLDNVGYTARHHTFFEMLGNFSFGDYFKEEAVRLSWDFLTKDLAIPTDRLYVTVYNDDDEAFAIWRDQVGVPEERIFRFDEKDNFWAMGDTGPCGPCSEIFFDYGDAVEGPADPYEAIESGSDKIIEIWNLVFMQYDRKEDGTLVPLPNPSIDTGMGLERVCSAIQGKTNNYDTDLFQDIIQPLAADLGVTPGADSETDTALRVIADHLRAMTFLIADGVNPSNEGRGYVLRRIMRRAMRYGRQLGQAGPFLHKMTRYVVEKMGDVYPQLVKERDQIVVFVEAEEKQFGATLDKGMPVYQKYLEQLKAQGAGDVPGQVLWHMYETHGFPLDLMEVMARDHGMTINTEEYEAEKHRQGESARGGVFKAETVNPLLVQDAESFQTEMTVYDGLDGGGNIRRMLIEEENAERIEEGEKARLVLDSTSFYAESGGQVGDRGIICTQTGVFAVEQTTKILDKLVLHEGVVTSGYLEADQRAETKVLPKERAATMKNHTATHILHQALRDIVGLHVRQAGSLVDPDKLRFDFSHFAPLSRETIQEIEDTVNARILENITVETRVMGREDAANSGAIAFFGEKYGETVRVVGVGDYSMEFCGGTHVGATGEIGSFKIISERGLASGVRRLVALTGPKAVARFQESESLLKAASDKFSFNREDLIGYLEKGAEERKALERKVEELKMQLAKGGGSSERTEAVGELTVILKQVSEVGGGQLRQLADELLTKAGDNGVVLLGSEMGDKAQLVVKTSSKAVHAGKLVGQMAEVVGGRGGGRPDMAMAGGKETAKLGDALEKGLSLIQAG
ncbi:MAG: alanine--tRNA ligase [Acidobacteriota bacterium]|nr:alanine--tRNA ligase [Acidobacteriota bacterium]